MAPVEPGRTATVEGAQSKLICRVRPCEKPCQVVTVLEREARIEVGNDKNQHKEPLCFDHLFNSSGASEQEELFELVQPGILSCFDGQSCTIVAHGGPQSGKSYTLSGFFTHNQLHGIAPRASQLIVDVMQANPNLVTAIESSFFEIQQDEAFDLVTPGYPRVGLRELSSAPYCVPDGNLATHMCDGVAGCHRLLDTYFMGLEHRRKGAHTCFQVAFVHHDGCRSYLRFIEVAWPKPTASIGFNGGKVTAVLEQAFHCKISPSAASAETLATAYKSSPLALLLKPCLEGASLLYFVHCLRLEQVQLPCLALVAPLLAKVHLWLTMTRSQTPHGGSVGSAPRRAAPAVPPLRLGGGNGDVGGGGLHPGYIRAQVSPGDGQSSSSSNSMGDVATAPLGPPKGVAAKGQTTGTVAAGGPDGGAGQCLVQSPSALVPAPPPEEMAKTLEGDVALDTWLLHQCSELMGMRQLSVHTLRSDAERSMLFLRDLHSILDQLKEQRHASETGPTERETNVKILYEKVYRSLQRTAEEIQMLYEDMEMINQFCGGGLVPPAVQQYPQYQPTTEELNHQQAQKLANLEAHKSHKASTVAAMKPGFKGVAQNGPLVVPALPLDLLPQEHPPQPSAWPCPVSPSSGSSVSTDCATSTGQQSAVPTGKTGLQNVAHPVSVNGAGASAASLASLPQTPPQPRALHVLGGPAVIQTLHEGIGHHHGAHAPHWRSSAGDAEEDARRQASAPLPRPQAASLGCSVSTMAGASAVVLLGPHGESNVQGRLRKSHSTASLRTLGQRPGNAVPHVGGASGTVPTAQSSPVLGTRGDGTSPLRGSLSGSTTIAARGAVSPPLPPKRPVATQAVGATCSTRASGSHRPGVRATTPAQRPNSNAPSASYSPMMLGRTLSTAALPLRYEKTALKVRPTAGATAPKRNTSPDHTAMTVAASPMRQPVRTNHQGVSSPTSAMGTPNVAFRFSVAAPGTSADQ